MENVIRCSYKTYLFDQIVQNINKFYYDNIDNFQISKFIKTISNNSI